LEKLDEIAIMTAQEILNKLDDEKFPILGSHYSLKQFHGDQKLTVYRNEHRWAMLIQILYFDDYFEEFNGTLLKTYLYSNSIPDFCETETFFDLVQHDYDAFRIDSKNNTVLNPKLKEIKVRDQAINIQIDELHFSSKDIDIENIKSIKPWEFMRSILPENAHHFWLTPEEISWRIPNGLVEILNLQDWYHPNFLKWEKPSDSPSFIEIASVIATGDASNYCTKEQNTHWSNWPEGAMTKQDILALLDKDFDNLTFPRFDDPNYFNGDQQLTLFKNEKSWALLIEMLVFDKQSNSLEGIVNRSYICTPTGSNKNQDQFNFARSINEVELFVSENSSFYYLNENAKQFRIRNRTIDIIDDPSHYAAKQINLEKTDKILPYEFMRGLLPEYSHLFWLTEEEVSKKIPADLYPILILENWQHPDVSKLEKPSELNSFQELISKLCDY
jgi:hypothetical protein